MILSRRAFFGIFHTGIATVTYIYTYIAYVKIVHILLRIAIINDFFGENFVYDI